MDRLGEAFTEVMAVESKIDFSNCNRDRAGINYRSGLSEIREVCLVYKLGTSTVLRMKVKSLVGKGAWLSR